MTTYLRRANERGKFDFGWLKTSHSFSFGQYYDPEHIHFGNLRVINEDFVEADKGFGTHPHKDMEIITYMVDGVLKHKDSMGNEYEIKPGEIQRMSAGTGITHSEYNGSKENEAHLFQIWLLPNKTGIRPSYDQKNILKNFKTDELNLIATHKEYSGIMKMNSNANLFSARLSSGKELNHQSVDFHKIWIQMISGAVEVNGNLIEKQDGIGLNVSEVKIKALENSEFLLFELDEAQ